SNESRSPDRLYIVRSDRHSWRKHQQRGPFEGRRRDIIYFPVMDRSAILARLKEHEAELRQRGVARVALFGSVARGEARSDSDIDLMVEVDPNARVGLFQYAGIVNYLQDLFPGQVDVADREGLKELVRPNAERDAIYAS